MSCTVKYGDEEEDKDKFIKGLISRMNLSDAEKKANERYLKSIDFDKYEKQVRGQKPIEEPKADVAAETRGTKQTQDI